MIIHNDNVLLVCIKSKAIIFYITVTSEELLLLKNNINNPGIY